LGFFFRRGKKRPKRKEEKEGKMGCTNQVVCLTEPLPRSGKGEKKERSRKKRGKEKGGAGVVDAQSRLFRVLFGREWGKGHQKEKGGEQERAVLP